MSERSRVGILGITAPATALLMALAAMLPTGFAIRSPGPTADTLGEVAASADADPVPLVEVSGAPTYPTSGRLLLTTVNVRGGPVSTVLPLDVLQAWLSPTRAAMPADAVFPPNITPEEQQERQAAQMLGSQEAATAAALTELGYEIPVKLVIDGAPEGSGAAGIVQEGDVLLALDGHEITTYVDLLALLKATTPGSEVVLGVLRDGQLLDLSIITGEAETESGETRAALGVFVASEFDFPIDVVIQIDDIGGPSAGLMFALAIIDRLTPEDELNEATVAGTGTIDVDGTVGPIGGILQKMNGAVRDGAGYFLAPTSNCDEAAGHEPPGLRVVKVATLAEARAAITAIGAGAGETLPTCGTE